MATREDYEGMTVEELRAEAADAEIEGRSSMNKAELVDALSGGGGGTGPTDPNEGVNYDDEGTPGVGATSLPVEMTATTTDEVDAEREEALTERIVEALRGGATTFSEDQALVIAKKFGLEESDVPFGTTTYEDGASPTAGDVGFPRHPQALKPEDEEDTNG